MPADVSMILIGNAPVITGTKEKPLIPDGCVAVDGDRILETGQTDTLRSRYPDSEFVDADGCICMPGLINAHEHIYSEFARGLSMPYDTPHGFLGVLENIWWPLDRAMTPDAVQASAAACLIECIKNGVTTVIDHHAGYGTIGGSLSLIAEQARRLGVRTCLCYEISDRDGQDKCREAIRENMRFIDETVREDSPMLRGLVGLHASFTLSDGTLDAVRSANTHHAGYHVHVAEGAYDEDLCREQHGCSIVERFAREGILGPDTIAAHCIHIEDSDLDLLRSTGTMVVHNPESNMNNAVGAPDILAMRDRGITVGLGTDGYGQDLLRSMQTANILQKLCHQDPARGMDDAWSLLFEGNPAIASHIFGLPVGILAPGAAADLILARYTPMTPLTRDNYRAHMMFGLTGAQTDSVMIGGRFVMRGRKLLAVDEEEEMAKARESAARLWEKF